MRLLKLKPTERKSLRTIARSSSEAHQVRRAQACRWLDRGESVAQVAERLGMSRQTIYTWRAQYQSRQGDSCRKRVSDGPHPGRPARKMAVVQRILKSLLTQDPRAYGYQAMVWTVALLCREVEKQTGESVSDSTMRRALRLVRYRHKRPRYVLTRRSPTWRQAKGGLKTA